MAYEKISTRYPALLILLTDELEESVKLVNDVIDYLIQINFDGSRPKNRCYIIVLGYNKEVKELCSGWLSNLDESPKRIVSSIKRIKVRKGDLDVHVRQPIWIDPSTHQTSFPNYKDSIKLATQITRNWSTDKMTPPIVIDCSTNCHVDDAMEEINQLKNISSTDGNVFFLGCYSNTYTKHHIDSIFSVMPEEWLFRLEKNGIDKNIYKYGLLNRDCLMSILGDIKIVPEKWMWDDLR